ncbi:MAG: tagaturonate epimerase family protein [Atribacterota bacterium]
MIQEKIQKIVQNREAFGKSFRVYEKAYQIADFRCTFFPAKNHIGFYLVVWSKVSNLPFENPCFSQLDEEGVCTVYPFDLVNYRALTQFFPSLRPVTFNHRPSFGCGDRLGMVSAAHLKALAEFPVFPVIAQQSPRELERTQRTFQDVLLGAVWGILESGYQGPFGADADHVKEEKYLLEARNLGFSMYTLDVSENVAYSALTWPEHELSRRYETLTTEEREIFKYYEGKSLRLSESVRVNFEGTKLLPLVLAYLPAIERVEYLYHLLKEELSSFDLEISLDEGGILTSKEAHFFVAEELHRRGIDFRSLALRFPGAFEKGIDYLGDLQEFAQALRQHMVVVRNIGGYRLSLHSGSDKFSVYPVFFRETGGIFHLKTSGTSWLEALMVVAEKNPGLFHRVYRIAYETFEENCRAYQLSVKKETIPEDLRNVPEKDFPLLLRDTAIRQFFHVAYGSILGRVGPEIRQFLFAEEAQHYARVCENIKRHLAVLFGREKG